MELDRWYGPDAFLQSDTSLRPDPSTGLLWRIPMLVSPETRDKMTPPAEVAMIEDTYIKRCKNLAKNWKTQDSTSWIPEELVHTTPYSLALLEQLAVLSRCSKGLRQEVHAQFMDHLQSRQDLISKAATPWITTQPGLANTENQIQERLDGLMLADVQVVLVQVRAKPQKVRKAEKTHAELPQQLARGLQRVAERRMAKQAQHLEMQRELWEEQKGGLELVGVEFDHANTPVKDTVEQTHKTKKQIRREAKSQLAAAALRLRRSAVAADPVKAMSHKVRANTIPQLISTFEKEENAWNDSESDSEDGGKSLVPIPLSQAGDYLEPSGRFLNRKQRRAQRTLQQQVPVEAINSMAMDSRAERKRLFLKENSGKASQQAWYEDVLAKSVRLPSERMDFSTLSKLENGAQSHQFDGMMGALSAVGMISAGRVMTGKNYDDRID